jgi:hypothetical protein
LKIILLIFIYTASLFSLVLNNKYILSRETLTSLVNADEIYSYIEANPHTFTRLPTKGIFTFSEYDSIETKANSSYSNLYIPKYINDDYIYIKIPSRFLKYEFSIIDYIDIVGLNKSKYYILRFKKDFKRGNLKYLKLDIGEKREFTLYFKDIGIKEFVAQHSNLLFNKLDLFDSIKINKNSIIFTNNYTKKDIQVNYDLKDFIKIKNNFILSKKMAKTFLLQINPDLPPLRCDDENLLESIYIDNEEFVIGEDITTENIYSLYLLDDESRISQYLSKKIDFIQAFSKKKGRVHTISYRYKTHDINIYLNLPKNISIDEQSKYINNFNNFKFKINGSLFNGYVNNKNIYQIQDNICKVDEYNNIKITNTRNYSEYKKWHIDIDKDKNSIIFTPIFNIYKIIPTIYAPFLLKKANKYVLSSQIDEDSDMVGEVKYAYTHNGIRFQSYDIINPKTNTNLYFKYPKNTDILNIINKTKFIYNSNPIDIVSSDKEKIKFTAKAHNKIALIYIPNGNLNSFRQYFIRHFNCNQEQALEDEVCYDYLADIEGIIGGFLVKLKKTKKYSQIIYRKNVYKEGDKKNLILLNQDNRIYEQVDDESVLGKTYDLYKWNLYEALEYDKKIFSNYGLSNIDLIYFSNFSSSNINELKKLDKIGFNKIFLINFAHKITHSMLDFDNIQFLKHKYNKDMQSGISEFDSDIFNKILQQLQ